MFKFAAVQVLSLFVLKGLFFSSTSYAASFDCSKARSNMEKAICQNETLSKLDEKLSLTYKDSRVKLSPTANQTLIASQRSWLRFTSTYCFIDAYASPVPIKDATDCLIDAYKIRIQELEETGRNVGEFKTLTSINHQIRVNQQKKNVYVLQQTFKQVDQETEAGKRLNSFLGLNEKAETQDTSGTEIYNSSMSHISSDWIYKKVTSERFTGAYPTTQVTCGVYSISLNRPLKISDIFQNQSWRDIFEMDSRKHFFELAKTEKDFDITMIHDFRPVTLQPSSPFEYCFSNKGIDLDGFLPHVLRAFDGVTISWHSLEKSLTPYARDQIEKMGSL